MSFVVIYLHSPLARLPHEGRHDEVGPEQVHPQQAHHHPHQQHRRRPEHLCPRPLPQDVLRVAEFPRSAADRTDRKAQQPEVDPAQKARGRGAVREPVRDVPEVEDVSAHNEEQVTGVVREEDHDSHQLVVGEVAEEDEEEGHAVVDKGLCVLAIALGTGLEEVFGQGVEVLAQLQDVDEVDEVGLLRLLVEPAVVLGTVPAASHPTGQVGLAAQDVERQGGRHHVVGHVHVPLAERVGSLHSPLRVVLQIAHCAQSVLEAAGLHLRAHHPDERDEGQGEEQEQRVALGDVRQPGILVELVDLVESDKEEDRGQEDQHSVRLLPYPFHRLNNVIQLRTSEMCLQPYKLESCMATAVTYNCTRASAR